MARNYTLKYRTFKSLLASVAGDFKKYQLQDLIDPQDVIKVAKRVTYDLGLRIYQTKERVLEVEKGRVRLPNDFFAHNFGLMLVDHSTTQQVSQGRHTEERVLCVPGTLTTITDGGDPVITSIPCDPDNPCKCVEDILRTVTGEVTVDVATPCVDLTCGSCGDPVEVDPFTYSVDPCDPCVQCGTITETCEPCQKCTSCSESASLNCKGETIEVYQVKHSETKRYQNVLPLTIEQNVENFGGLCPDLDWAAPGTAKISDGWLYTSFQTGSVYINYQGLLEDDDGNLLVLDHDLVNEYYEYALKQRILENLIMNDEEVNPNKIQLIETRYRDAKRQALSFVNTPNFGEIKEIYQANRNAFFSKYYDMFGKYSRTA